MYYPVFLNLKGKRCLVIGGGKIAERKTRLLLKAGARVSCLSEAFRPSFMSLARNKGVTLVSKRLNGGETLVPYLSGIFLVVAATSSPQVNQRVYEECRKKNVLVNAVDDPEHSNFIAPSIFRRGDLSIAISTGGVSPEFAKSLRRKMEPSFGPEHAAFLRFMSRERRKIMQWVTNRDKRKQIFQSLVRSPLLNLFKTGDRRRIREAYRSILLKHGIQMKGGG